MTRDSQIYIFDSGDHTSYHILIHYYKKYFKRRRRSFWNLDNQHVVTHILLARRHRYSILQPAGTIIISDTHPTEKYYHRFTEQLNINIIVD